MGQNAIYERRENYNKFKKYTTQTAAPHETDSRPGPSTTKEDVSTIVVKDPKKADYVLVYSKRETERNQYRQNVISTYTNNLKQAGLIIQEEKGLVLDDLIAIKITAPNPVLVKYTTDHKIELTKNNPHYKYHTRIFLNCMNNVATGPKSDDSIVQRAYETLSGARPTDYTNAEKTLIIDKILSSIQYGDGKGDIGYDNLVSRRVILAAYPLHDSPYHWTTEGPLTDRQLLARYWANTKCIFKEQPLSLIERYYGPEVGFYFAWIGCYTKMLIIPAIFGLLFFFTGLVYYDYEKEYIEKEICNSELLICPVCPSHEWCGFIPLKNACKMMKMAHILENPVTVVYAVLMSFWGVIFLIVWKRKQAMLRLRWNINDVSVDRRSRPSFLKAAKLKGRSSVTGEDVYYIPFAQKLVRLLAAYLGVLFMIFLYCLAVIFVMYYRLNVLYYGRRSGNKNFKESLTMFTTISSSFLTFVIMIFLDTFKACMSKRLTEWENPRTQESFNKLYTIKLTAFSLGNTFFPMVYLAFIKGHSYTHPGDAHQWTFRGLFKSDACSVSGCLVDLSVQLVTIMVLKNILRLFSEIMVPIVRVCMGKFRAGSIPPSNQWEEDFILVGNSRNFLYSEYMPMVLQYGFMTFFVVALPIAPFLAFLNNIFEIRFDAIKYLKKHRRLIPKKVTGMEEWNVVLQVITVLGAISNPLLIAFNTNLIPRYIYMAKNNNSLKGFINSTLSEFSVYDYPGLIYSNERKLVETCYYYGMRNPPSHPERYERNLDYWYQFAVKSVFFIILENVCLLLSLFLGYVIPEIPQKVQIKMENDQSTLRGIRLA